MPATVAVLTQSCHSTWRHSNGCYDDDDDGGDDDDDDGDDDG